MKSPFRLKSIEDASVLRKFSVLFTLMSLAPFVIMAVTFLLFVWRGNIKIDLDLFFWIVLLIGIFSSIGFIGMRKPLVNLNKISTNAKEIIAGNLSKRIDIKAEGSNEVTELARAFNEVVQQLENNIKQLERSRNTLQDVLLKVASGVSTAENIDAFLGLILETTVNALDGKAGLLLIIDEGKKDLIVRNSYGLGEAYSRDKRIPLEDEVVGWVIKQKKPLLIPRLHKVVSAEAKSIAFEPPLICTPLIFQGKVIGAISISGKKQEVSFEEDELIILSNIGSQVALAIENARLNADNQKTYMETVTALALAVEARDVYSRGHSDRVSEYAVTMAQIMGLNEQQIKAIKEAAELHDVGKIGISDDILRKPDLLNDVEQRIIQQHTIIGEGIIIPLHGFSHLRDSIRHHHEWLNGEGYPDHLKDEQISIGARILAVADSFDAMTTDRPYRKGMSFSEAAGELLRYKGIRYDERVLEALVKFIDTVQRPT